MSQTIEMLRMQAELERARQRQAQEQALLPMYQQRILEDQARAKEQARIQFEAQERARREAEARARAEQAAAAKARAEAEAAYLRQVGAMSAQQSAPRVVQPSLAPTLPQASRPVYSPLPAAAPVPVRYVEDDEGVDPTLYVVAGVAVVGALIVWVYTRRK